VKADNKKADLSNTQLSVDVYFCDYQSHKNLDAIIERTIISMAAMFNAEIDLSDGGDMLYAILKNPRLRTKGAVNILEKSIAICAAVGCIKLCGSDYNARRQFIQRIAAQNPPLVLNAKKGIFEDDLASSTNVFPWCDETLDHRNAWATQSVFFDNNFDVVHK